ncbi:GIY-YIG nuclease family protein [Clostridium sporogenes]|uniref:GIY-YIG nuclease family protein n=1 Tax=Clostridium sporogenes TaxID=1509 RepID=UPI0013D34A44|nr:GIY-YIG nuclease family protein [Clostridium sporogenes]MBU5301381.1 GIY-YIG nuclease family protein [Clostridium sporogenes]NFP92337.1 GIY-YIG nuclease family protein [Clostridium sporogenes]
MAYVYIVECRDGTLYTGWTTDIERRISEHNKGKGAKYTRVRRPVVLKYFEKFDTNREAMKRECEIKKLSRKDKIKLFDYN